MIDLDRLEKVIKGLEICSAGHWNSTGERDHTSYPYYPAGCTGCTGKLLMREALAVIKDLNREIDDLNDEFKKKKDAAMGEIVDLYENKPHKASIVICLRCYKRWMELRLEETLLQDIQCPQCGEVGLAIESEEEFDINQVL